MSQNRSDYRREFRSYAIGLLCAVVLTAIPFLVVAGAEVSRYSALMIVGALAIVQILVHFRFFLHVDLSRQKREDLQLILFSSLLLIIMVAGTIWIMTNLYGRMMSP